MLDDSLYQLRQINTKSATTRTHKAVNVIELNTKSTLYCPFGERVNYSWAHVRCAFKHEHVFNPYTWCEMKSSESQHKSQITWLKCQRSMRLHCIDWHRDRAPTGMNEIKVSFVLSAPLSSKLLLLVLLVPYVNKSHSPSTSTNANTNTDTTFLSMFDVAVRDRCHKEQAVTEPKTRSTGWQELASVHATMTSWLDVAKQQQQSAALHHSKIPTPEFHRLAKQSFKNHC